MRDGIAPPPPLDFNRRETQSMALGDTGRQEALLVDLARYVEASPHIGAMVLLGSFAKGTADAMSDLDLFFVAHQGQFESAWQRRGELHVTGSLIHWDEANGEPHGVGGHRWLTSELVLVESVITTPKGGGRLAEPYKLVVGDPQLVENFPERPPIERSAMTGEGAHPVDLAYEKLKNAVRGHQTSSTTAT